MRKLSWLLVFTLVISSLLQPMSVYGTELLWEEKDNIETVGSMNVVFNPLYEDVIDKEASIAYHKDLWAKQELDMYSDTCPEFSKLEDALKYIRQRMAARDNEIYFTISADADFYSIEFDDIFAYSDECTGQEGDALKWGWKSASFSSTYFYFEYYTDAAQEQELTEKVEDIMVELDIDDASEIDKIDAIYNYICDNVNYDWNYARYSAWDALCTGTSVCQGYAISFYRLAKEADLSVRIITSENHAWNIVRMGDVYYNVDTTWDGSYDTTYDDWYMKSMEDFPDHIREAEYDTPEFHAQFPMAEDSWVDTSAFPAPLELTNEEFILDAIDGGTVTTKAEGRPKLLIFFSDGCYNSQATIRNIKNSDISGVDIVAFEVQKATVEETQTFADTYGRADMEFSCDSDGSGIMWDYARAAGFGGSVTFPVIAYIDADDTLQAVTIGIKDASTLKTYLKYYCGWKKDALSILEQPESQTVTEGENAVFSVVASGKDLSYQWQYSTNGTTWNNSGMAGAKTASITVAGTTARNGQQYRCVITDTSGNTITSDAAILTVKAVLGITSQPASVTVTEGANATFKVVAKGEGLTYQWQYKVVGGNKWNNSSATGAKTARLVIGGTLARNGQQYRCVITDGNGKSVTSNAATLTVKAKLAITSQPTSQTIKVGEKATFKVVASGSSLSYQWQYKVAGGSKWNNCTTGGAKTATLTVEGTEARNGQQYRCIVKDGSGNSVTSNVATLTVKVVLAITTQPASQTIKVGEKATFKVVASGSGLSYQWQYKTASGTKWYNSSTTGAKTASITIEGTEARNGQQYRCVITDGSGSMVTSNAATLIVKSDLAITSQPTSQTVTAGEKATFKVVASGSGLSYQWQYKVAGGSKWNNSSTTGAKTASITIEGTETRNGQQYRCIITDGSGNTVTSNAATLTVKAGLAITSQPASQTVSVGGKATFKVVASGSGLSYQWQYKVAGGSKWNNSSATGAKTASLTIEGTEARNGQQYRCVITDGSGNTVTSNAATLTVKVGLAITSQPTSQTVSVGGKATFIVVASGSNLSYQWQYKVAGGSKWNNSGTTGANTASITIEGTEARNGQQYRCVITDGSGNQVISNAVTLSVE